MFEKLPDELKQEGRFCLWKYEKRKGKINKVPYRLDGKRADPTDTVFADVKHGEGFSYVSKCRFIIASNYYPDFADKALEDRMLVIRLCEPHPFCGAAAWERA